ncbi:MAG: hypothetical protein AVDCRST_MAG45-1807, partial [uncultured Solirubrobacterales bacterium]
ERAAPADLDPHRLGRELSREPGARLRRGRAQGTAASDGAADRAGRSDRLLRDQGPSLWRDRPHRRRAVRGPGAGLAGQAGQARRLSVALRRRARAGARGGALRRGRAARGTARARAEVAGRALAPRLPGPAAGGVRTRRRARRGPDARGGGRGRRARRSGGGV